jgi:hypothetical protein
MALRSPLRDGRLSRPEGECMSAKGQPTPTPAEGLLTLKGALKGGCAIAAEYGVLAVIEDAPLLIKAGTAVLALGAFLVLHYEARIKTYRRGRPFFIGSLNLLIAMYVGLGIFGYVLSCRPAIQATLDTISLFRRPGLPPMYSAIADLRNVGNYSSGAQDFSLFIHWTNGEVTRVKAGIIRDRAELPYTDGSGKIELIDPEDDLNQKAFKLLPPGAEVRGRLMFQSADLDVQRILSESPHLQIDGVDSHGKQFSSSLIDTGPKIIGPYLEFPGIERRWK